jgi:glutamyl-tRNA reductase
MRKHVPLLKELKTKLKEIHQEPIYIHETKIDCQKKLDLKIQQVLNDTAGKIKIKNERGCQYISAINEFISAPVN